MTEAFVSSSPLPEFPLWGKVRGSRGLISFEVEVTARCNNNCRHCYINLPAGDKLAKDKELSFEEITEIADEAVSLGAVWCLITGGEPLLREDFFDLYLYFKRKGLLIAVFTNATLVTEQHVKLFRKFPPRDVEVSVYGVTQATYENVTRKPGSFAAFANGLNRLIEGGVRVRLKAMALRSNVGEFVKIDRFCREKTKDVFRWDPFLHLRFDRDPTRNAEIRSERLSSAEIVSLERADWERAQALERKCHRLVTSEVSHRTCDHLFHCGAGQGSFVLSCDGLLRLCSSLWHPDCVFDLRKGNLTDALRNFVPRVRDRRSDRKEFRERCHICSIIDLCQWCPAHAHLETEEIDKPVDYFCNVAHARAEAMCKT